MSASVRLMEQTLQRFQHRWVERVAVRALLLTILFLPVAHASRTEPREFDFGPIASRHKDVHDEWHLKGLGPFFEKASATVVDENATQDMHFVATRPFYSSVDDPAHDRTASDYLWPLATKRSLRNQSNWRALIFFGFNHDTEVKKPRYRLWLIPFYFQGRDAKGLNYRAVFPLGGSLHEFIGRDEINFVLFPIRSTSKLNDLRTSNWLWPIISETKGDETYRRRVFPFYGYSRRDGQYEKKFVMWPIWNQSRYYYTNSSGFGYILFPLVGHMKLTDQETWWAIPPLFRFTHGKQEDKIYCPWPFFQYAKSHNTNAPGAALIQRAEYKGYEKLYIWPLWGHKRIGNLDQTFYLWPLIWRQQVERTDYTQRRFLVVPFFIAQSEQKESGEISKRYNKFWPLYSYRRQGDESRFRMLELWPFAEAAAVERNWAPLWTLYSRVGRGQNMDCEFLWGLYRNQKRGSDGRYFSVFPVFDWKRDNEMDRLRRWNLLKGLIGYERDDSRSRIRLLYFLHLNLRSEKKP